MSGDELRVTTAHLGDLSVHQGRAAAHIRAATVAADGADTLVTSTHGTIAAPTAAAVKAVLATRQTAGTRMAGISDALSDKLTDAANRYGRTDAALGGALDDRMRVGRP